MSYIDEANGYDVLKRAYKFYKNGKHNINEIQNMIPISDKTLKKQINKRELLLHNPENFKENISIHEVIPDEGFLYIPNPFKGRILMSLLQEALTKWPCDSNKMNLDIEDNRPSHIWNTSLDQLQKDKSLKQTWLYKLRWTSLGYHYHWSDQTYSSMDRSPFPPSLGSLSQDLALLAGHKGFEPEAGIVNYYHLNSAMCFHVDHAELAKDVPLVSISFGQPGVYLLGGPTRSTAPVPLLLRHGDVVLMTGPSRLAYHAVPRVISTPREDLLATMDADQGSCVWCGVERCADVTCSTMWDYMECSRVNINVRQVLPVGQTFPE